MRISFKSLSYLLIYTAALVFILYIVKKIGEYFPTLLYTLFSSEATVHHMYIIIP